MLGRFGTGGFHARRRAALVDPLTSRTSVRVVYTLRALRRAIADHRLGRVLEIAVADDIQISPNDPVVIPELERPLIIRCLGQSAFMGPVNDQTATLFQLNGCPEGAELILEAINAGRRVSSTETTWFQLCVDIVAGSNAPRILGGNWGAPNQTILQDGYAGGGSGPGSVSDAWIDGANLAGAIDCRMDRSAIVNNNTSGGVDIDLRSASDNNVIAHNRRITGIDLHGGGHNIISHNIGRGTGTIDTTAGSGNTVDHNRRFTYSLGGGGTDVATGNV